MNWKVKRRALLHFVLFTLPLIAVCLIFNKIYFDIKVPVRLTIPADTEILILGDSHVTFALDPKRIGRAINFSSYGESYIQNYYKLKFALSRENKIHTVILPTDLHSFSDFRRERIGINPRWDQYIDFWHLGWIKKKPLHYLVKYLDLKLWNFKGNYALLFDRIIRKKIPVAPPLSVIDSGFLPKKGFYFRRKDERGRRHVRRHLVGYNHFDDQLVLFFRKILALCESRGINVVLVRLPLTRSYCDHAAKIIDVEAFYQEIERIRKQYKNTYRLNYQRIYFDMEEWLFYDSEHINQEGARSISDLLRENLVRFNLID